MNVKKRIQNVPPVIWIIIFLIIIWSFFAPGFFSGSNLYNIGVQAAPLLILAIGETLVILTEGIDLSAGFVMGFCGVVAAACVNRGYSLISVIVIALAAGLAFGYINGFLIVKWKLPPFIATMGVGYAAYGISLLYSRGISIPALRKDFRFLYEGSILHIRTPIVLALVIFAIIWVLLYKTRFGRNIFGLGGNVEALRLSGINIDKAGIVAYAVTGFLAGFTGIIIAAKTASGHPATGLDWDFDAIAATIIGGTSFEKGKGGITYTVLGVLLITILRNGLNVAGIDNMYQYTLIGLVVLGAIIWDVKFKQLRVK